MNNDLFTDVDNSIVRTQNAESQVSAENDALIDTEELDEQTQQTLGDIAFNTTDENIQAKEEQEEQNDSLTQEIPEKEIAFDPERPISFVDATTKQKELVATLEQKIYKVDEKTLNNETRGILRDIIDELRILSEETNKISSFFFTPIPKEDKEIINRTTLIKGQLVELYDTLGMIKRNNYEKQIRDINKTLRNFMLDTQNRIKTYDENLRASLSERLKHLNSILQNFNESELENVSGFAKKSRTLIADSYKGFENINKNFKDTSEKLKKFGLLILIALIGLGGSFGVLSGITYLKYAEYKEIEQKMASLSQRIDGIVLKKDKKNNLILSISKENAYLQESKNSFDITIRDK